MKTTITEEWQYAICARDSSSAMTRVSELANLLYPEIAGAKEREAKFMDDGGSIAQAIKDASDAQYADMTFAMVAWRKSNPETVQ